MSSSSRSLVAAVSLCVVAALAPAAGAQGPAPGAPGTDEQYLPADKSGLGTSATRASRVWFTVQKEGGLGEVYFPTADAPSARALQFVVGDHGRAVPANDAGRVRTTLVDARSLTYRQVFTAPGRWRLAATYVADPARATVLVRLRVASLDGRRHRVYAIYDPALANTRAGDSGRTQGAALVATDQGAASALVGSPAFRATSSGFRGVSDGWTDLADGRLDWRYASADAGNVVQTAKTSLTGRRGARAATLALGFGTDAAGALTAARASTARGFANAAAAYARGWHAYLAAVKRPPASLRSDSERTLYRVSVMTLAASEDKTHPGAYVASPTMPWIWGHEDPSERVPPGLVARPLPDRDRPHRGRGPGGREPRAGLPVRHAAEGGRVVPAELAGRRNARLDGPAARRGRVPDRARLPARAHRRGRWDHVKRAADFLVGFEQDGNRAPWTPQERWENQSGYSPATIASEIAGLVCAAVIAERNGDAASAQRYRATADAWQARVKDWTVTTTGPYSPGPYFLRVTKDGNPNAGTTYAIGDSGPSMADQRTVVDPSFLDLVRLGVLPADDPAVVNSLGVVDRQLGVPTANGLFWHRASFDGYGEKRDGEPVGVRPPGRLVHHARPRVATAQRRARRVPARRRRRGGRGRAAAHDGERRRAGSDAPRAGLGHLPAGRHRRLRDGTPHLLGDAPGLDPRPVPPAGLGRAGPSGPRAAPRRGAPLRRRPLTRGAQPFAQTVVEGGRCAVSPCSASSPPPPSRPSRRRSRPRSRRAWRGARSALRRRSAARRSRLDARGPRSRRMAIRFDLQQRTVDAWLRGGPRAGARPLGALAPRRAGFVYTKGVHGLDGARPVPGRRALPLVRARRDAFARRAGPPALPAARPAPRPPRRRIRRAAAPARHRALPPRGPQRGPRRAGAFDVVVTPNGAPSRRAVDGLGAGDLATVTVIGPRCASGTTVRVVVDARAEIAERDEADDVTDVPCPFAA